MSFVVGRIGFGGSVIDATMSGWLLFAKEILDTRGVSVVIHWLIKTINWLKSGILQGMANSLPIILVFVVAGRFGGSVDMDMFGRLPFLIG